ncbi:ttrS [Symbiodinium sp. CCMP2592]|nr:ttrS [Symbiodinium sp. CCMP2592]
MLEAPRTENEELASSGKMEPLCIWASESGSEAQGDGFKEVQPYPVLHKKALKTSQQVRRAPLLLRPLQPSASVLDPKRISGQSGQGSGSSGFIAKLLEFGPPIVILLNAITIALDSDVIENDSILRLVESCFAMFYLLEFMIKLGLLGCRGYFWAENWTWNWFDFLCLLCALLELSAVLVSVLGFTSTPFLEDVTVVRVFRLGQLMRTVRVLNFKMFGELRQITLGIMNGCGVLFWAVVLLFGVIYVFGVVMRNLVGDAMEEFKNIPNSMFTLFRCFTDGCSDYAGTPLAERLRIVYGAPFTLGYVCVTMLVAVGIFNMIMAIFLENATASAGRRKQRELGERANSTEHALRRVIVQMIDPTAQERARGRRGTMAARISGLFDLRPTEGDATRGRLTRQRSKSTELFWHTQYELLKHSGATVDRKTFMLWLQEPAFLHVLESADVDVSNKFDLFDVLDSDMGGRLELDEVVTGLMKLRGVVCDIACLSANVCFLFNSKDLIAIRLQVISAVNKSSNLLASERENESRQEQYTYWFCAAEAIGGLAIQGAAAFEASLSPTFQDFLTRRLNESHGLEFEAVPLDFNQNFEFVSNGGVEFIFSNPAAYTCMAVEFNLQTVASLINYRKGNALGQFAGVIFARQDSAFHTIDDLRNARVEAVSISGLGAMQLQQAELLAQGLNIMTDVPRLTFAFNQNKIVQDVELGLADVGFVRTDLIDRNVASNLTKWEYFRVIGQIPDSDFPFARSTAFTPEWPIGALPHVTDEVKELVASSLMALDRFSPDPELSQPAIAGNFASWSTPMNYFGLLDMLQSIEYYDRSSKKCLRSSDEYEAIRCPAGFVKKGRDKVFCEDCRIGYSCLCSPCAKLRDPEYVMKASLSSTAWRGNIDVDQVNNLTTVASSCERMSVCGQVFAGQKLRWVLLDQIGTASRTAINAPLVTSVQIRTAIDGSWFSTDVRNVTIDDEDTQEYTLEYDVQGSGTQVVQVDINGQPAALSPVVLEVLPAPLRQIECPPGREADFDGACTPCAPGTASAGGGAPCRPCDPGTFQPLAEQSNCEACAVGTFQESPASLQCELCPPGYSSRGKIGSLVCSPCDPGQEAPNNGSERCSLCPRGFYSQDEGSSQCLQCSGGKGTTEQGVTNPDLCICLPGEFIDTVDSSGGNDTSAMGGQCIPCTQGLVCPGGNGPPLQKAGFWVDTAEHGYSAYRCRDRWQCPEGLLSSCSDGREGLACNNCKEWHRQGSQGKCKPCEGVDVLPAMLLLLATVLTGGVLLSFVHTNAARQRLGQVTVFLTAGQIILMLQLMAAMRNLDLQWTGPALYVFEFLEIFAFDVDFLNIGCVVSNDGAVLTFAMQLLAYPVFAALLILVWVCISRLGLEVTGNDVINMNGLALLTLYMTLTINSLLPLQCVANPNGTFSMQTQPGVICFQSDEHWALMFMCVLGILMYPVAILSVALRATIMYPHLAQSRPRQEKKVCKAKNGPRVCGMRSNPDTTKQRSYISSGKGLLIVNRYRFLFERFRSLAFWQGVEASGVPGRFCLNAGCSVFWTFGRPIASPLEPQQPSRNTLLALIPVAVASFPTVQVVLLAAVHAGADPHMAVEDASGKRGIARARFCFVYSQRCPGEGVTDMLFSTAVVLFLVVAGPILSSESAQDRQAYAGFLSWSFTMLLAFAFLTLFVTIGLFLWRASADEKTFKIFLTHHKSAAGALARFIKSILNKHSHDKVFLDSDELQDLDSLFESVRSNVAFLVPLLTPQMISRPWCVGELVTAHFNRVPLLPISCDGYRLSSSVNAAQLVNAWSPDDFQPLLAVGIQEDMIDAMIEHLYALPSIALNRRGSMEDQEATILRVITSSEPWMRFYR